MVAAAKPGGWVVVTDTDWVQFDAQADPRAVRHALVDAARLTRAAARLRRRVGPPADRRVPSGGAWSTSTPTGNVWTMHGGTDSAEWYVGALARALDVVPPEIFPDGFDPARGDRPGPRARLRHPLADLGHRRRGRRPA